MKGSINSHAIFPRDPAALFTTGEYRGRSLADWMGSFARCEELIKRRPGHPPIRMRFDRRENTVTYIAAIRTPIPPRKPVQPERFVDYQRYRGKPEVWAMMRLSAKVGARRA